MTGRPFYVIVIFVFADAEWGQSKIWSRSPNWAGSALKTLNKEQMLYYIMLLT